MANSTKGSEAKLQKYGIFFVLPFIVIYLFFQLWPTIYTVMLSFTDNKGMKTKGFHMTKTQVEKFEDAVPSNVKLDVTISDDTGDDLETIKPDVKEIEVDTDNIYEAQFVHRNNFPPVNGELKYSIKDIPVAESSKIVDGKLFYDYSKKLAKIRYGAVEKQAESDKNEIYSNLANGLGVSKGKLEKAIAFAEKEYARNEPEIKLRETYKELAVLLGKDFESVKKAYEDAQAELDADNAVRRSAALAKKLAEKFDAISEPDANAAIREANGADLTEAIAYKFDVEIVKVSQCISENDKECAEKEAKEDKDNLQNKLVVKFNIAGTEDAAPVAVLNSMENAAEAAVIAKLPAIQKQELMSTLVSELKVEEAALKAVVSAEEKRIADKKVEEIYNVVARELNVGAGEAKNVVANAGNTDDEAEATYKDVLAEAGAAEVAKAQKKSLFEELDSLRNVSSLARVRGITTDDIKEVFGIEIPNGEFRKFKLSREFKLKENGIEHTYLLEQDVIIHADKAGKCTIADMVIRKDSPLVISAGENGSNDIVTNQKKLQRVYELDKNGNKTLLTSAICGDFTTSIPVYKVLKFSEPNNNRTLLLSQSVVLDNEKSNVILTEELFSLNGIDAAKVANIKENVLYNVVKENKNAVKTLGLVKDGVVKIEKKFTHKKYNSVRLYYISEADMKIDGSNVTFDIFNEKMETLYQNKRIAVGKVSTDSEGKKSFKATLCKSSDKEVMYDNLSAKCLGVHFVGGENFSRLVKDKYFWESIGNTFIMWLFNFIPQLGIALLFAIWFTDPRMHIKGKNAFRAMFYMPNLLTAASVAILYRSLFGYPNGPINQFLYSLGIQSEVYKGQGTIEIEMFKESIEFFRSIPWSRGIVSFIQWWLWCGQTLIMLMAGITSISPSLYESAVVDGANQGQQTWYITLPLLKPMMLYILITGLIGGMQLFEIPFLLTDMYGGPQNKIRTMVLYMYNQSFQGVNDYAYGAAIAMGVFVITMALSMFIYFFMQDRSDMGRK